MYAGTTVRLCDGIGLRYLAHLMAHPHQRILVEGWQTPAMPNARNPE